MQTAATTQYAAAPPALQTTSTVVAPSTAEQAKSQFLQLLVAQLKGQNPLDPKDGAEFIAQLAQFASLEELINIRKTMETFFTTPPAPTTPFEGA
jgi:flagellar basal-body rod modification protein FlgD